MLLTGIIFIFVAPIIYIKSPGPIFFKQVRIGKNGKKFNIYKFRSMYMDAEERKKELIAQNNIKDGMMFKMDNDPRIIKGIGNFIRDYSLDEFPQFWTSGRSMRCITVPDWHSSRDLPVCGRSAEEVISQTLKRL